MLNELIIFITILSVFAFIMLSFNFGRRWLYVAISLNLLLIGVFGAKITPLFGSVTNAGNIFYAGVFLIGQLLVEHFGLKEGKKSIWIGFAAVIFFTFMGQLTINMSIAPEARGAADILNRLFEFSPRIALASIIAYLLSQSLNIHLYGFLYEKGYEKIWLRSLAATVLGQFLDSIIFFNIAFWGVLPAYSIIVSAGTGFMVKVIVGALSIPLIYLSYKIKSPDELLAEENEAIVNSIGEGVIVTDRDGIILTVNKMFESLMGYRSSEVIGSLMTDIVKREDENGKPVSYQERILNKVLSGKRITTAAVNHSYFVRKDGRRFPVKITVTPIRIDHKIIGAVEVFINVSSEQQLEKTRVDFLTLASHQLRTPLSATRWVIETLKKGIAGDMTEKQKKYLNQIYEVNKQMINLANETLNILRLDSGIIEIKKDIFKVATLFLDFEKTLSLKAKEKKVVLAFTKKPKEFTINSDYNLVKTIITTFIANSINYSDAGRIVVIDAKESGDKVIFFVKDQGIGIPDDEKNRIFERFYRASNAKQIIPDGTGLGLSMARMLAEKLNAKISFESTLNKGTTFSLTLPK